MATLFSDIHYWLVDHPTISQYEFKQGHTLGSSPLFVVVTVIAYLSIIFILHHFPILPPLSTAALRRISAVHSIVLCLLSLVMAAGCSLATLHQMPDRDWTWIVCFPANHTAPRGPTFFWAHVCYFSKILEFLDTLLILLGGSRARRRLSFLHLFHHSGVVAAAYLVLSAPQSVLPVAIVTNSAVHVLMYGYYFLCAVGYRPTWKRLVTDCQIIQFVFGFMMSGLMLYYHFTGSGCSGIWAWFFNYVFVAILLALFLDFHNTNYSSMNRNDHNNKNE